MSRPKLMAAALGLAALLVAGACDAPAAERRARCRAHVRDTAMRQARGV